MFALSHSGKKKQGKTAGRLSCGGGGGGLDLVVVIAASCFINQEAAASETGCFWFPSINTKRSR